MQKYIILEINNVLDNRILDRVANGWLPIKSDYKDTNYYQKIQNSLKNIMHGTRR